MKPSTSQIRWGILGTSAHARQAMIPAIRESSNGQVFALASRDPAKCRQWASELGLPRACASYDELLADPDVDAIYNPLPVSQHLPWALKCAEAGKPMLCEKPLAASAAEARQMAAAFSARQLPVAESLMYRFHPLTRRYLDLVRQGVVGRPVLARSSFTAGVFNDDNIRFNRAAAGGALRDLGCYCVSILRAIAGSEPRAVKSLAYLGPNNGVDEGIVAALAFPDGLLATLGASFRSAFECSYELVGSEGRLLVDFGAMVAWPGGSFKIRQWRKNEYLEIEIPAANHYRLAAEDFARAVLTGTPPAYPMEDSIRNLEVMDAILRDAGVS